MSANSGIEILEDVHLSGKLALKYNGKTYIVPVGKGVEDVISIDNSGLVYVAIGETVQSSLKNQELFRNRELAEPDDIEWQNKIFTTTLVTVTFKVYKGLDSVAYDMVEYNDPKYGLSYGVDSVWRGFMVEPKLFGKYRVGIYLRYKGANEHAMMAVGPAIAGKDYLDLRSYFKLSPNQELKSGPYEMYG